MLDVAVDIRKGSPTYGKHVAVELTEDNHRQFFIPKGFAHGFAVLSETAVFQYKCDNFYHPEADGGISILDDSLGIDWKIPTEHANLSEKDTKHAMLKDLIVRSISTWIYIDNTLFLFGIDYAVMEKSKEIYTLPAEFGWSDLGSWGSLRTLLPQDENGNAKIGKEIRLYECKNCVVHAADESKVVVQGLDSYIVAEKNGQLLVCSLKEEQRIKEFGK